MVRELTPVPITKITHIVMTIPVTICDDSSFARKQISRALPRGWDIEITYAANGIEGLEAIRAGKAEFLFLDLTMPELDGFGVLEALRREKLESMVIVVSGDIQSESKRRVHELGALAFLKKPVDQAELHNVLTSYGVIEREGTSASVPVTPSIGFNDWCQEIANVAMGRAAALLAQRAHHEIELSIPRVELLTADELQMMLNGSAEEHESLVIQGFVGGEIAGESLLFIDDQQPELLATTLNYPAVDIDGIPRGTLVMETANILSGSFMKGFAELLDIDFSQGHPVLYLPDERRRISLARDRGTPFLAIDVRYTISHSLTCDQLLLFSHDSMAPLRAIAELFVESAE